MPDRPLPTIDTTDPAAYDALRDRLRSLLETATPAGATVAVVSRGDPDVVALPDRTGWHFPVDDQGRYAGFHPADDGDALDRLHAIRAAGADYLCLPATAFWWLDHYDGLAAWLDAHCRVAALDARTAVVYDLGGEPVPEPTPAARDRIRALLESLLPDDAVVLVAGADASGLDVGGREVVPIGRTGGPALRRLTRLPRGRAAFLVVPAREGAPEVDAVVERFLAAEADVVAHRPELCDVFAVQPADVPAARPPARAPVLAGARVELLTARLHRLGLGGRPATGGER